MKMIYNVNDRPPFGKLVVFSLQQLLAIITATIAVPMVVSGSVSGEQALVMNPAAAMIGAGFGTITYLLFTKFKSPVFLGSSFAFISPLIGAVTYGYFGVLLGAAFAAVGYALIALVVYLAGTNWINKLMPPVVIGPTVALIGLSLAGSAMGDITHASGVGSVLNQYGEAVNNYNLVALLCGLVTFFVVVFCSLKGNRTMKLIPFVIGIIAGYALAAIFSAIGYGAEVEYLKIVNWQPLIDNFKPVAPESFINWDFSFLHTSGGNIQQLDGAGVAQIALLYLPVTFVVFAEHLADHKNISNIIERDLLKDPGLHRTLLGDGIGSFVGSIFGGSPNTTYGESVGCVAITRNASVLSILGASVLAIVLAFCSPVVAFMETIPACVMGGVCLSLYGFIAVSGLNMLRGIDLGESKNLFVVCSILIAGIGGLSIKFGAEADGSNPVIEISSIATALILGILVNVLFKEKKDEEPVDSVPSGYVEVSKSVSAPDEVNIITEDANGNIVESADEKKESETAESENI